MSTQNLVLRLRGGFAGSGDVTVDVDYSTKKEEVNGLGMAIPILDVKVSSTNLKKENTNTLGGFGGAGGIGINLYIPIIEDDGSEPARVVDNGSGM